MSARCAARRRHRRGDVALRRGLELARRELFRGELDDPMRAVLIFSRKLGEALAQAGDYTDAEGVLREALDMAGPSGTGPRARPRRAGARRARPRSTARGAGVPPRGDHLARSASARELVALARIAQAFHRGVR